MADPILPLGFITHRPIAVANMTAMLFGGAAGACVFVISQYLQVAMGLDPSQAGLALAGQGLAALAAAPLVGLALDRLGMRNTLMLAFALIAIGNLLFFWRLDGTPDYWTRVLPGMVIHGVGVMFGSVGINAAATSCVPDERQGLAASLVNIIQQFGVPLVMAFSLLGATAATSDAFDTAGTRVAMLIIAAVALLGL